MAMIEINWRPSLRELRAFAAIWLVFFGLIGVWFYLRDGSPRVYGVLWAMAGTGGLLGLLVPGWLRPVYITWMCAAFPIGWFISHLILAVVYFGLLLPIGLVLRLSGYDPMHRKPDGKAASYWSRRTQATDIKRYFRQV